jgi:hypothetical protein
MLLTEEEYVMVVPHFETKQEKNNYGGICPEVPQSSSSSKSDSTCTSTEMDLSIEEQGWATHVVKTRLCPGTLV